MDDAELDRMYREWHEGHTDKPEPACHLCIEEYEGDHDEDYVREEDEYDGRY